MGSRWLNIKYLLAEAGINVFHSSATLLVAGINRNTPWYAAGLQHVGNPHVPGPDVKLPFLQAQHSTQDRPRVDADPHFHAKVQLLAHEPGDHVKLILPHVASNCTHVYGYERDVQTSYNAISFDISCQNL